MDIAYSIIIPAFNEEESIECAIFETVRVFDALNVRFELIVVDDGSSDRTVQRVARAQREDARIFCIRHEKNQGKGAAVVTGVRVAQGNIFLFLDADLATHPREIYKCIPLLERADIIIGSRRLAGSIIIKRQSWIRVLAGKLFNRVIVRWYLGLPYEDTQCGFKVFRQNTKHLFEELHTKGWAFDAEILMRAKATGLRIAEIPVEWRDTIKSRVHLYHGIQILKEAYAMRHARKVT